MPKRRPPARDSISGFTRETCVKLLESIGIQVHPGEGVVSLREAILQFHDVRRITAGDLEEAKLWV